MATDQPTPRPAASAQPPLAATTVEEVVRTRLAEMLGGWRGSLEAALPTLAFVGVWMARSNLREAVVASLVVAALLAVVRLVQRQTLRFVLSSLFATAIAAFFALRTGRAGDAFLPGLLNSGFWFLLCLVSIATRWPLLGFVVGAADPDIAEDPFKWRRNHALVRVCTRLTWVLSGLYGVRLLLMVPFYLANNVAVLGVMKIALGWPLYLAALAVMAGLILRGETPLEPGDPPVLEHDPPGEAPEQG